jgi:integrase
MGVKVRFFDGAWYVFINHHGRRRAKKCGDKPTALEVARKVRGKLAAGDLSLLDSDSEGFAAYAARWLKDGEATRKASTHRFYDFNLKLHVIPALGTQPIATMKRADCRRVVMACRQKGLKLASLRGVQRTLSAVLSQAVDDGILPANPAFRMGKHLRLGDEHRAEIQPLTREEAHRFLETIKIYWAEYYAFFLCALRTGLRLGELCALQWGDIDFAGRFIEVRRNIVSGKVTTPKNTNRRRVDMSLKLTEALEQRLKGAKKAALKAGESVPAWLFANREGKPIDGDNLRRRVFEKALTKAGLRHVRIHDLRHTYASLLIQNGESLVYVQKQLGHSSIQVTVDVYGHLIPGANRAAVDRLDLVPANGQAADGSVEVG